MNRKKIFGFLAIIAIAAGAVWNVNLASNKNDLSEVNLANIEALAIELPEVTITCDATCDCLNGQNGQCYDQLIPSGWGIRTGIECEFSGWMRHHCCCVSFFNNSEKRANCSI
jgi:hypothetical protein